MYETPICDCQPVNAHSLLWAIVSCCSLTAATSLVLPIFNIPPVTHTLISGTLAKHTSSDMSNSPPNKEDVVVVYHRYIVYSLGERSVNWLCQLEVIEVIFLCLLRSIS